MQMSLSLKLRPRVRTRSRPFICMMRTRQLEHSNTRTLATGERALPTAHAQCDSATDRAREYSKRKLAGLACAHKPIAAIGAVRTSEQRFAWASNDAYQIGAASLLAAPLSSSRVESRRTRKSCVISGEPAT